jgi:glyoxylase-like metal-dependent hydrolase (beta-lactamase superfamily II)
MKRLWAVLLVAAVASPALGLDPNATDLFVRVADTGPALCGVVKIPPGEGETRAHFVIYDAGNYTDRGECAFEKIKEVIPPGSDVDLLVLSHSDSDHLGPVADICDAYKVKRVLRSGYQRTSSTWKDANDAIRASVKIKGCVDINLRLCEFPAGATYRMGNAFVQMVCGFHKPPAAWGP